jgi:ketosteroid isomerase-like protein
MTGTPDHVAKGQAPAARDSRRATGDAEAQVLSAARALIAAFAANRVDEYFACFHPEATFIFAETPALLASRAEYRAEWDGWVEDGFEVLSCVSSDQRVQVFGALAVFTHSIATRLRTATDDEEASERETIVFARQEDGAWMAVHEHVSPAPRS